MSDLGRGGGWEVVSRISCREAEDALLDTFTHSELEKRKPSQMCCSGQLHFV